VKFYKIKTMQSHRYLRGSFDTPSKAAGTTGRDSLYLNNPREPLLERPQGIDDPRASEVGPRRENSKAEPEIFNF
jgi:hypothetical protein